MSAYSWLRRCRDIAKGLTLTDGDALTVNSSGLWTNRARGPFENHGRSFRGPLTASSTGGTTTSGTAYWVYIGTTTRALTPTYVRARVTVGGAGAQTAEMAIASTPLAPNPAGQTLTIIEATGSISDLTTGGMKTNSSAFTTAVQPITHLWAGFRAVMATTQPTMNWVEYDLGDGFLLQTAGAGALTGSATFAGAAVAGTTVLGAPNLGIRLD